MQMRGGTQYSYATCANQGWNIVQDSFVMQLDHMKSEVQCSFVMQLVQMASQSCKLELDEIQYNVMSF